MTVQKRIEQLRKTIQRHDKLYYVFGAPEITDAAYDKLFNELRELEAANPTLITPDSPTQRVGGEPIEGMVSVPHAVPMLSVDNGFDLAALRKFHERCTKKLGHEPKYAVDWKIDGCAISLIYTDGVLTRAVTRGDGAVGDDITHNARVIRGVPSEITTFDGPKTSIRVYVDGIVEVRGEAYIPNSVFRKLVEKQKAAGEEPFKNSRNAAAGALRQLDPKECYARGMYFIAHGIGQFSQAYHNGSWWETLRGLHYLGIPMQDDSMGGLTFVEAMVNIDHMIKKMAEIDYPVDGIVLKLDTIADREAMGQESGRHVSWAMAYKWERYEAETKIARLDVQVGKQGALTPVAYYEPIEIAGTTVQKSTLFNFDEVKRLDPRVGDTVTLEKAGKIIPHLVCVHKDKRTGRPAIFHPPKTCPACGSATERDGAIVVCPNSTGCKAQLAALLEAAADRSRMDIDGLGPSAIEKLMGGGALTDFASLWALERAVDAKGRIPGLTPGKSKKLLEALTAAKDRPSWRLMASLNIKHCGRTTSELICKAIQDNADANVDVFETLTAWTTRELQDIEGVGDMTATSIVAWLGRANNITLLNRLRELGVNTGLRDPRAPAVDASNQPFAGMSICATGKLVGFTREGIIQAIVARGGKAASSVSKNTTMLVAGADAGSKLAKAQQLGVRVINEDEFKQLAGIS